ncbi:dihydrofolate reductase isoform X1 [Camelus ferus]|uniref:Dihydrofolate reductase n=2 Tax=Camelus ferus TaxID=419612 RepID=A0A8B8SLQ7_CAMFR|nr:dihydrofolate reductase isoform X1 [Camelus dromedarius]XP_032331161.1 dihydrofolate reductase isoform X1 [Camelus ferus]
MVRPLNCIVAVSQNMGIGKNGDLPWPPLRNEFKYFQRMTTASSVEGKQNLVIMGRKTWFSIPEKNRPLKDRINLVLSRELKEPPQGAHFLANSLDDALKLIEQPELTNKVDMVWIVGGSSVYKEAMDKPGHLRLFVTRIMQEFESDMFFPEIDLEKYKLLSEYAYCGYFILTESYEVFLGIGFFHLAYRSQGHPCCNRYQYFMPKSISL